jgi:hypothetical protein
MAHPATLAPAAGCGDPGVPTKASCYGAGLIGSVCFPVEPTGGVSLTGALIDTAIGF